MLLDCLSIYSAGLIALSSQLSDDKAMVLIWLAFAVVSVITVFVCIKAGRAYKKRQAIINAQNALIEKDRQLYRAFKDADEAFLKSAEPRELIAGLAIAVQAKVEKAEDPVALFETFSEKDRYVYSLDIFLTDSETNLSHFFRNNGKPVTNTAVEALRHLGLLTEGIEKVFLMLDEDTDVSYDPEFIKNADEEYKKSFDTAAAINKIREYLLDLPADNSK